MNKDILKKFEEDFENGIFYNQRELLRIQEIVNDIYGTNFNSCCCSRLEQRRISMHYMYTIKNNKKDE